jgi:hypothetical protein
MRDEVRIHLHSDPAVPGTRWWAESDSGFIGGSDELSGLVSVILDWAEADGIEVSFALVMEDAPGQVLADRTEFVLSPEDWGAWEALQGRPARDIPELRELMAEPSPFFVD